MIIGTIGRPGSGKTTAGKIIASRLGLAYVGAGDVARKLAETDDETAAELAAGRIAPPRKMKEAMEKEIRDEVLLDGFPRYMEQLTDIYRIANDHRLGMPKEPILFVWFDVSPEQAMSRLLKRARTDDQKEQIIQRLSNFRIQTRPVIEYLLDRVPDQVVFVPEVFSPAEAATVALNYIKDQFQ
jgi:adenylate kinase family enzyme